MKNKMTLDGIADRVHQYEHGNTYQCKNCDCDNVGFGDRFCSNCGDAIEWTGNDVYIDPKKVEVEFQVNPKFSAICAQYKNNEFISDKILTNKRQWQNFQNK